MDRIIDEAARLYNQYGSGDLDYMAQKLGAEIYEKLDAQSLKEVYFPDLRSIVLRPGLPRHERSFLIAHGLGHHLFHQEGPGRQGFEAKAEQACGSLRMGWAEAPATEREADTFAAYLLVPEDKLREVLSQEWVRESEDAVLKLALEFQVPVELMMHRLVFEGLRR